LAFSHGRFEVGLAHAGQQNIAGFLVPGDGQRDVLVEELGHGREHLVLVTLFGRARA